MVQFSCMNFSLSNRQKEKEMVEKDAYCRNFIKYRLK